MKKVIAFLLSAFLFNFSHAQEEEDASYSMARDMLFIGYEVSIPANDGYLSETSWSGVRLDYRKLILPNLSIGYAVSFNNFEEYFTKQTYQREDGSGAITSDMIRQIFTLPVTIQIHYYLKGKRINPYVGLGLGTQYSDEKAYFNIYRVSAKTWGFLARPEIGLLSRFNNNISGYISAAYNFSTNDNDVFKINNLSHFPITIGLVFNP